MIPGNFLSAVTEQVDPDTSGWAAVLNCAKSLGSGGRAGDGVLTLTSTAAGEMQAVTTSAYPITAGTLYQAFADASSADQPERIGVLWLDADYAAVGTTWSLTTTTASSSWHRISVGGVAPVGAVQARVVLSATTSAASKISYFENVYLGPPKRTSGNLLGFNTESGGDVDGTAWAADANCTVVREAPMVSWPVDYYLAGGEVVRATATANGAMSVVCTERPAVAVGTDYQAYAFLSPPAAGSAAAYVELRWHDAGGTLLSSERSTLDAGGTGWLRQRVSGVAPAGAATVVLAAGIASATAGQVLRLEAVVLLADPDVLGVNGSVLPYEDASFEQGVGAWTVSSGVATIARTSPWSSGTADGSYALAVTSSTTTASTLLSGTYPITGTGNWRPRVSVSPGAHDWQIALGVRWYDDTSTLISTTTSDTLTLPSTTGWWTVFDDLTPPAGAVAAAMEVILTPTAASSTCRVDAVALYPTVPASQAVAHSDLGEITVILRELAAGSAMTLWRVVGAAQSVVRGADGWVQGTVLTGEQFTVEDYEAPLGRDIQYRYELVSPSTGALVGAGQTNTAATTVSDPSDCWIKDPLQPQRNVLAQAAVAPDWSRPIEQTEYRIRGRRNSVILSDVRGGLTGSLDVWTLTDDQRAALHFALDTGNSLLLQFDTGLGLEDAYFVVGDVTEARVVAYGGEPRRRWSLALTQVDAPPGGVGGTAGWTVRDVVTTYATVRDVLAAYSTVLDLVLDNRAV